MLYIIKIICILFVELNVYYCLGCVMGRIKFLPKIYSPITGFIYGFLGYHFIFWCIAFSCTYLEGSLLFLTRTWMVFFCILLIIFVVFRKEIIQFYKDLIKEGYKYKFFIIPCILLQAFLVYYVCINGQADVDARTYIGEITSMVDTDRLAGISATTGYDLGRMSLKRSFTMFGANSAVLCSIFRIHPLIFCRTVRATINIIMLAAASFEILKDIYRKHNEKIEHAIMALMLAQSFLFLFANSIFTSSSFILYRAYEGKAYCSGTLVLITINLAVMLCRTEDRRFFVMIFIHMVVSMSISASATFIMPIVAGSILSAYILVERKWKYIILMFCSIMPNIVYIMMCLIGISGFVLEG